MTKTMTKTKTNTFGDHLQRAIPETCDLCVKTKTMTNTNTSGEHLQKDPRDLRDLRH